MEVENCALDGHIAGGKYGPFGRGEHIVRQMGVWSREGEREP